MSTTESLRLSMDNANGEIQRLEAENRRLREAHPERVLVYRHPVLVVRGVELSNDIEADALVKLSVRIEDRSLHMVCIIIYRTKEQCGQISVERACERYLLSLLRS